MRTPPILTTGSAAAAGQTAENRVADTNNRNMKIFHEPLAENQKMLYFIPAVPLKASLKTELPTVTRFSRRGCPALSFFGALPLPSLYIGCHLVFFFIFLCSPPRLSGAFSSFSLYSPSFCSRLRLFRVFSSFFLFSVSCSLFPSFLLIFRAGCFCAFFLFRAENENM